MVKCYECGAVYKSRLRDEEIRVYDSFRDEWTSECPNCGKLGFDEADYINDFVENEGFYDDDDDDY